MSGLEWVFGGAAGADFFRCACAYVGARKGGFVCWCLVRGALRGTRTFLVVVLTVRSLARPLEMEDIKPEPTVLAAEPATAAVTTAEATTAAAAKSSTTSLTAATEPTKKRKVGNNPPTHKNIVRESKQGT